MARRALLVGCNYPGSSAELKGCVNDCTSMQQLLQAHFGFEPDNVELMLDTDSSTHSPTGKNVKVCFVWVVGAWRGGVVWRP